MIRLGWLCALLLLCSCERAQENPTPATRLHRIQGEAMGSYYKITYRGEEMPALKRQVDSLLDAYNLELSAWVPESAISRYNRGESIDLNELQHFQPNLELAHRMYERTDGAFDPTVGPLVNFWGFGTAEKRTDSRYETVELQAVLELVGMDQLQISEGLLTPHAKGAKLDFNASAKGYGVDLLHELLNARGRPDHLIDIGGEMRAGGTKYGQPWRVGIRAPEEDASQITAAGFLDLANGRAIATSGNYLNYYRVDTVTYSHTVDPRTGLVERNALLSASILAPDCATADALATACMVLGPEGAQKLVAGFPGANGYFIIRADDGSLETITSLTASPDPSSPAN